MTDLQEALAADFLLVDGLEAVTFQRPSEAGDVASSAPVAQALRRAATLTMVVGNVLTTSSEAVAWHIPALDLATFDPGPRKGDIVLDGDGARWVVWTVELLTLRTRYKLTCIRE